jgi:cytoskeletal protein RodZ
MTPGEKKLVIVVGIAILALLFYYWYKGNSSSSTTTSTTVSDTTPSGTASVSVSTSTSSPAAVSLPDPISVAASVSGTAPEITAPIALSSTATSFVPGVTSPEEENAGAAAPSTTLPSGFQAWYNSLGPINKAWMANQIPTMAAADIAFINNVVNQNLWGTEQIEAQWNAFVAKYQLPQAGTFSSFTGVNKPGAVVTTKRRRK